MMKSKPNIFKRLYVSSAIALASLGTVSLLAAPSAFAQEPAAAAEGRQFGAKAGEQVLEAQNLMSSNQFSAAVNILNTVLTMPELNPYEKSTIYQMQGACYYELNQYSQAIQGFENAINAGGLLPNEVDNLRVNISQLLIANGQYARGAQMLEDWNRRGGNLKPSHIDLLVQAWVQAENYSRALPWAERWFNAASPKERKHFDLMNFLYVYLDMPDKQANIAKQMHDRWPSGD